MKTQFINIKTQLIKMLLIAFVLFCSSMAMAQQSLMPKDTPALRQKLQAKLDEWHKSGKFAGATVGIAFADGTSLGLVTGFSDLQTKAPMKADDLMLAGSVGKTYAAAVALQLVSERKINLEDKIEKHLGAEKWFARLPNAKDVTVR